MKTKQLISTIVSTKQLQETRAYLQTLINKKVNLTAIENNKKLKVYSCFINSVSTNVFIAKISLNDNSGSIMKSFNVSDVLTQKISIQTI